MMGSVGLQRRVMTMTTGAEAGEELLTGTDIILFRGLAARCNYLALDRPDIQYPAKEVCREAAKPTIGSLKKLERLGRYFVSRPRLV